MVLVIKAFGVAEMGVVGGGHRAVLVINRVGLQAGQKANTEVL
jgi:hypothetical protein